MSKISSIRAAVLTQYRRMKDTQQTRADSIASRG